MIVSLSKRPVVSLRKSPTNTPSTRPAVSLVKVSAR